jgi:hypothetical protein
MLLSLRVKMRISKIHRVWCMQKNQPGTMFTKEKRKKKTYGVVWAK